MKQARLNLGLIIVSAFLGILISTSFFTHKKIVSDNIGSRKTEFIETIKRLESEREELKKQLDDLRKEMTDIQKTAAANEGVLTSFSSEVKDLEFVTGLTPVKGPGLEIILADNPNVPLGGDPNSYLIHDYDLKVVVNALWAGGAEAIAINTQRLVNSSSIRCVGNTIMVNSTRLVMPYHIRAIGDTNQMEKALEDDNQANQLINDIAKVFNLTIDITKKNEIKIPGYKGSIQLKYPEVEE